MKSRRNAKENFIYCFLLGIEEAKERGDYDKILECIKIEQPDQEAIYEFCNKIAHAIESGMFAKAG